MKTFLLSIIAFLTITTLKAQTFSENFNSATISSLTTNCWILSGAQTSTVAQDVIQGVSLSSLPATNVNAKTDVYSPILSLATSTPNVKFDYKLSDVLSSNSFRIIEVGLVTTGGILVKSNIINLNAATGSGVHQYNHTFTGVTPGNYRAVFRMSGGGGSGNVRISIDNFEVSPATVFNAATCIFAPIVESTLPIKLKYFTVQLNDKAAELNWVTSMELNFSHFVVERSYNGTDFTEIATLFGFGNSMDEKTYKYIDKSFSTDKVVVYYRLRQVDIDEKAEYSATRIIKISAQDNNTVSILAYPNPVANEVRVTIPTDWQNKVVVYEVFNMSGQIATKVVTSNSGQTEILNVSKLNKGMYIIRAICEGKTAQQKIIKQ